MDPISAAVATLSAAANDYNGIFAAVAAAAATANDQDDNNNYNGIGGSGGDGYSNNLDETVVLDPLVDDDDDGNEHHHHHNRRRNQILFKEFPPHGTLCRHEPDNSYSRLVRFLPSATHKSPITVKTTTKKKNSNGQDDDDLDNDNNNNNSNDDNNDQTPLLYYLLPNHWTADRILAPDPKEDDDHDRATSYQNNNHNNNNNDVSSPFPPSDFCIDLLRFNITTFSRCLGPVRDYIPSGCGVAFDQYVRDHFRTRIAYGRGSGNIPSTIMAENADDDNHHKKKKDDDNTTNTTNNNNKNSESATAVTTTTAVTTVSRQSFPDLWPNRPLRLLLSKDSPKWQRATVKELEQTCQSPMSYKTEWFLTVEMAQDYAVRKNDNNNNKNNGSAKFGPGDFVQIFGLKSPTHNDKLGVVLEDMDLKKNNYKVQLSTGGKVLAVKQINLKFAPTIWKRQVHRLHPVTGGTLIGVDPHKSSGDNKKRNHHDMTNRLDLISFEWLDQKCDPEVVDHVGNPQALLQTPTFRTLLKNAIANPTLTITQQEKLREFQTQQLAPRFEKHMRKEFLPMLLNLSRTDEVAFGQVLMEEPFEKCLHALIAKTLVEEYSVEALQINMCVWRYRWKKDGIRSLSSPDIVYLTLTTVAGMAASRCSEQLRLYESVRWNQYALQLSEEQGEAGLKHPFGGPNAVVRAYIESGQFGRCLQICRQYKTKPTHHFIQDLNEWIGNSDYHSLEIGDERLRKMKKEDFQRFRYAMVTTGMPEPDRSNLTCIDFDELEQLTNASELMLEHVNGSRAREALVQMMEGNFLVEWQENNDTYLRLVFYMEKAPQAARKKVFSFSIDMTDMPSDLEIKSGKETDQMKINYDMGEAFEGNMPEDAKQLVVSRAAFLFLKYHSDKIQTRNSKSMLKVIQLKCSELKVDREQITGQHQKTSIQDDGNATKDEHVEICKADQWNSD